MLAQRAPQGFPHFFPVGESKGGSTAAASSNAFELREATMNALADAAFLSSAPPAPMSSVPPPADGAVGSFVVGAPYSEQEMHAMGLLNSGPANGGAGGSGLSNGLHSSLSSSLQPAIPPLGSMRGLMQQPGQLPGPGRHLQILDHTVHRIDAHTKANGEEEKEMVVSNLRHFNLKIGVLDPRMGVGRDAELPLKAELLYENGQLVEQLATCEPLLVGKTEVVAMQGTALFKLRITSLSSHRDKQRFRIRVSPVDTTVLLREPGLSVVTTPMKCVTKLSHRSSAGSKGGVDGEGEDDELEGDEPGASGASGGTKRKRDETEALLEQQGQQLMQLQKTNADILEQLNVLKELLSQRIGVDANGTTSPATEDTAADPASAAP